MQKRKAVWPWVIVGVVAVGGAGWWLFKDDLQKLAAPQVNALPEPSPQVGPSSPPEPAAPGTPAGPQYPLAAEDAADPALPGLGDSDAAVWQALGALFPADALGLLLREHLVQRVVVHIDNLTQPSLPATAMAVRPLPGALQVEPTAEGGSQIAAANSTRYAPYVAAFRQADMAVLGSAYRRAYPLFQQAYREAGHPQGHFNDRLVAVIDHLLTAPEPQRPLAVQADERGRQRFVDPALQQLSVGQKALLRLDAAQAAAVKQQLRALRAEITRG